MANPQTENGYTKIANELFEKIGGFDFLASEFRVINCVLRKTYGWNKKEDIISLTQFEDFTNLSRPTIVSVLKNLKENRVLIKINNKWKLNKNWEEWGGKAGLTSKAGLTRTSKHRLTETSKAGLTHKRKKEIKENSTSSKEEDATNNKTMKNTWKYNEKQHSDVFEDSIDIETGESTKPKEPKRQKAINYIKNYFSAKCEKEIKIKPVLTYKQNIMIANLFNRNKMKPSEITDVIDWWFDTEQDKAKLIHIGFCLNATTINNYKASKIL